MSAPQRYEVQFYDRVAGGFITITVAHPNRATAIREARAAAEHMAAHSKLTMREVRELQPEAAR